MGFTLTNGRGVTPFEPNLIPREEKVNKLGRTFQMGFAGNSTGASHALGVPSNSSVSGFQCGNNHPISKCQQSSKW